MKEEIGKAEVAEQEDALERTRQAAIHEKDVEQQGEEEVAIADDTNDDGGDGGGEERSGESAAQNEDTEGESSSEGAGEPEPEPDPVPSPVQVEVEPEEPEQPQPLEPVGMTNQPQIVGWKTGADVKREAAIAAAPNPPKPPPEKKHKGLRAVVVGNGPSVIVAAAKGKKGKKPAAKPFGSVIDSYDHVYRFNLFKTKGYEKHVGTKTTHWVLSMIKKAADVDDEEVPAITAHLKEILIPMAFRDCKKPEDQARGCPGTKGKNAEKKKAETAAAQKRWEDLPQGVAVRAVELPENRILYDRYKLYEKFPSTGLMILNMAAEQYDEVAFVGFDFESADHQHYWEVKVKNETCHNMNQEAQIINQQIEEGRLTPLVKKNRGGGGGGAQGGDEEGAGGGYDPNCKILCGAEGCMKLTGATFAEHKKNPKKWEKEHKMTTPRKMGLDAMRKNSKHKDATEGLTARKKDAKDGLAAEAASGL